MWLLHPPGTLYLRQNDGDEQERVIAPQDGIIALAPLPTEAPRARERGAPHHAFGTLFALPFAAADVSGYVFRSPPRPPPYPGRKSAGWTLVGAGAAALIAGAVLAGVTANRPQGLAPSASQEEVVRLNRLITTGNAASGALFGLAGASAAIGAGLLFWPGRPSPTFGAVVGGRF